MKKLLLGAVSIALLAGCSDKGGGVPPLENVVFITSSSIDPDSGNFSLYAVGVSGNASVDLSQYNVDIRVDSVVQGALHTVEKISEGKSITIRTFERLHLLPDTQYTVQILRVEFEPPTSNNKAVAMNFDQSGSLISTDPNDLRIDAGKDFIRRFMTVSGDKKLGIFSFSGPFYDRDYYFRVVLDFTTPDTTILHYVDSVNYEDGATPLYCSLVMNLDYMNAKGLSGYDKILLSFTDGEDNDSETCPRDTTGTQYINADSVWQVAKRYGVKVFFVALDEGGYIDPSEMKMISDSTGGITVMVSDPDALNRVFSALSYASGGYNVIQARINPIPPLNSTVYMTLTACDSENNCFEEHFSSTVAQ